MFVSMTVVALVVAAEPSNVSRDLIRAVTQRLSTEGRSAIPDSGLLPAKGALPLRAQLGDDGAALTADLVANAKRWTLKTRDVSQAEADRAGKPVYVVAIGVPDVEGDVAQVSVGVEIVTPSASRTLVLCCCTATDTYRRDARGVWRFEKRGATICS